MLIYVDIVRCWYFHANCNLIQSFYFVSFISHKIPNKSFECTVRRERGTEKSWDKTKHGKTSQKCHDQAGCKHTSEAKHRAGGNNRLKHRWQDGVDTGLQQCTCQNRNKNAWRVMNNNKQHFRWSKHWEGKFMTLLAVYYQSWSKPKYYWRIIIRHFCHIASP